MTSKRRTIRASAVLVAVAATTASASAFSAAQADDQRPSGPAAIERHDPAPQKDQVEHDLEGPFSKQQEQQRQAALEIGRAHV